MILRWNHNAALALAALVVFSTAQTALAKIVGTNMPAESITRERIATLPAAERGAWFVYLTHSERQRQVDKGIFRAELKRTGIATPTDPPHGFGARSIARNRGMPAQMHSESPTILSRFKHPPVAGAKTSTSLKGRACPARNSDRTMPRGFFSRATSIHRKSRTGITLAPSITTRRSRRLNTSPRSYPQKGVRRTRLTWRHSCMEFAICFLPSFQTVAGLRCGRSKVDITMPSLITTTRWCK
jgi:hypothetical protein